MSDVTSYGMGEQPSLRELLEQRIAAVDQRHTDAWHAHNEVHKHEEEARSRALAQMAEWKQHVNEVREQINSERALVVGRDYYDAQHRDLQAQVQLIRERQDEVRRILANYDGRLVMLGSGLVVLNIALALVFHLFGGK